MSATCASSQPAFSASAVNTPTSRASTSSASEIMLAEAASLSQQKDGGLRRGDQVENSLFLPLVLF
jgi:hypothetical protein